jgi:hypothetical protein
MHNLRMMRANIGSIGPMRAAWKLGKKLKFEAVTCIAPETGRSFRCTMNGPVITDSMPCGGMNYKERDPAALPRRPGRWNSDRDRKQGVIVLRHAA